MPTPHEIIGSPYEVWVAPEGTAFPLLHEDPSTISGWELLGGTPGDRRYSEGISVMINTEINEFVPDGSTMAVKAFRSAEASQIQIPGVANLTVEEIARILDRAGTTTTTHSSNPDTIETNLKRGPDVAIFAVLARGASPYDNSLLAQWQVPRAYHSENMELNYSKAEPTVVNATFALLDPESRADEYIYIAQQ